MQLDLEEIKWKLGKIYQGMGKKKKHTVKINICYKETLYV